MSLELHVDFTDPDGIEHHLLLARATNGVVLKLFKAEHGKPLGQQFIESGGAGAKLLASWLQAPAHQTESSE